MQSNNSYKICGFPPPTSGGIGLIQIISILNNKKNLIQNKEPNLAKHLFIEASRLAYQDRNLYIQILYFLMYLQKN